MVRDALLFLPHSGLRATEVCKLSREGVVVHKRGSMTLLVAGKNGKVAQIHVPKKGAACIKGLLKRKIDTPWLFPRDCAGRKHIVPDQLQKACRHIAKRDKRFEGITPHYLRHTFVSSQLGEGVPLPEIKEKARHNSMKTTLSYVHPEVLDAYWVRRNG